MGDQSTRPEKLGVNAMQNRSQEQSGRARTYSIKQLSSFSGLFRISKAFRLSNLD